MLTQMAEREVEAGGPLPGRLPVVSGGSAWTFVLEDACYSAITGVRPVVSPEEVALLTGQKLGELKLPPVSTMHKWLPKHENAWVPLVHLTSAVRFFSCTLSFSLKQRSALS